jgi:hypothetical protein
MSRNKLLVIKPDFMAVVRSTFTTTTGIYHYDKMSPSSIRRVEKLLYNPRSNPRILLDPDERTITVMYDI